MFGVKITVVLVFLLFGLFACTASNESGGTYVQIKGNQAFEATVFRQNCAICHGPEADGKVVDGTEVPSLRTGPAKNKSLEEIYQQIKNGKLPMPSFESQLSEKIMRDMAVFIYRDLQGRKLADKPKADGAGIVTADRESESDTKKVELK